MFTFLHHLIQLVKNLASFDPTCKEPCHHLIQLVKNLVLSSLTWLNSSCVLERKGLRRDRETSSAWSLA